jgi:hypothetical protein
MKKKTRSLLKKYQFGTEPNLLSWDWSGSQSSIPGNSNFSVSENAPAKGGSFNSQSALSGQSIAGYATAAINLGAGIANAVAANKASSEQLSAGKRNKALFDIENAKNRSAKVQKNYRGMNFYGNYPTMQYGGMYGSDNYSNPYANTFNSDQLNTEQYMIDQQTGEAIAEDVSNTVLYSMPGFGQIMQAAAGVSESIRGMHGEKKAIVEDGSYRDVYGLEGDTPGEAQARGVISSMVKPAHEHGMESFSRAAEAESSMDKFKYSMEGIGDMLGFTTIPKMIKTGMDSKANQEKMARDQRKNALRTNVGGTSGLSGETIQGGNFVDSPYAMRGKMGGYLKQYQAGGMVVSEGVPEKYANAELEGREIIEKAKGPDIYVKGPSHERGGVPMMLEGGSPAQGGDYVWSDHLTYKGNTMAELYAMAVQSGASEQEIDQLRMLQEQLAGRAGDPQDAKELQEMPMAKKGGMLKKYQLAGAAPGGTNSRIFPDGTEIPVLSDSEYNRIMKEKQMKDLEALQNSDEYNKGMANLSWAPGSAANVALGKYGKLPSKEEVEREREMKRAADVQYYREQGLNSEGQPYSEEDLKSANAGEVGSGNLLSKTGTQIYGKRSAGDKALELLPYGTAGAGMIAQLAATLGAKNPYKGIKTPSAALVSTPEKQFFERINSRAEEAQNARGASLSKQLLQQAGFGPGEMAAVQKVELDRQAADAQATQRAREFNVSQDRAEKQLNTEMKLRSEMANQSALNERSMQEYQRMLSERGFETERGMNTGDIIAGSLSDIGKFASDRTFAKAIEGDSGVGQRAWNYDPVQARAEIMSENPQKDGESGSEYQSRINRLERENSKRYEEEYMRKVAERRRRYTQMRGTDGEQG